MKCCYSTKYLCIFVVVVFVLQETKPSSQDGGDKKDGEYIKLKVIGQVCGNGMWRVHASYTSCCGQYYCESPVCSLGSYIFLDASNKG